jgi:hypothetical protein
MATLWVYLPRYSTTVFGFPDVDLVAFKINIRDFEFTDFTDAKTSGIGQG